MRRDSEPGPPRFGKDCIQSPPEVQRGVQQPNRATILAKQIQEQERKALKNAARATALQDLETAVGDCSDTAGTSNTPAVASVQPPSASPLSRTVSTLPPHGSATPGNELITDLAAVHWDMGNQSLSLAPSEVSPLEGATDSMLAISSVTGSVVQPPVQSALKRT